MIKFIRYWHSKWYVWCGDTEWKPMLTAFVISAILIGLFEAVSALVS